MNADAIFDAFDRWSSEIHRQDALRKELARLRENAARNCGNCYFWMKSSLCPIDDQRRGFPSCGHPPCGKFQPTERALDWQRQYETLVASTSKPEGK